MKSGKATLRSLLTEWRSEGAPAFDELRRGVCGPCGLWQDLSWTGAARWSEMRVQRDIVTRFQFCIKSTEALGRTAEAYG